MFLIPFSNHRVRLPNNLSVKVTSLDRWNLKASPNYRFFFEMSAPIFSKNVFGRIRFRVIRVGKPLLIIDEKSGFQTNRTDRVPTERLLEKCYGFLRMSGNPNSHIGASDTTSILLKNSSISNVQRQWRTDTLARALGWRSVS